MNTYKLAAFSGLLTGTLVVATALLSLRATAPPHAGPHVHHATRTANMDPSGVLHTNGHRAHPTVHPIKANAPDAYAQYLQHVHDQAIEYRMAMTGARDDAQYPPAHPSVDFNEAQEAAIEAGRDPFDTP